jgi:hypothetical protein
MRKLLGLGEQYRSSCPSAVGNADARGEPLAGTSLPIAIAGRDSSIPLYFALVADPVRDLFDRSGFLKGVGGSLFRGVDIVATFLGSAQPQGEPRA